MKFEWEVIHEIRSGGVSDVTLRMRIIGGWLIKSVYVDDTVSCKPIREHALVFVPDARHVWESEKD
jgi:hypothetical protein